jgi:tetratricopeptide (TPR) repeat protein
MSRTISEDIFILIRSLSMSEKRYFKHFASMGNAKDNTIYLRLFDIIESQKKYNEKKILKKIPEIKPLHLSSKKNYLSQLILESLKWFHSGKSVNAQLWSYLSEIEILYNKRLFKQCAKQIKKAKGLAQHYEKQYQLVEILEWEEKVLDTTFSGKEAGVKLSTILTNNIFVVQNIRNIAEYRLLNSKLLNIYRLGGGLLSKKNLLELHKLMQHPLVNDKKEPNSYAERYYHYRIAGAYYYMLGDNEKFYSSQKKLVENFEKHPEQIEDSPQSYVLALNNFMSSCQAARKDKEFENTFYKVEHLMQNTAYATDPNIIINMIDCRLSALAYYIASGEFEKGVSLSGQIESFIDSQGETLNKGRAVRVYFGLAQNYFGGGNYKKALVWLNKIINDKDTDVRNDLQVFARLLNLIVHFELGNERELEYYTKSTYHFLLSKDHVYKVEIILLDFIRKKIPKTNSRKELIEAFEKLKSDLERTAKDPFEQQAINYFDFVSWLESKISGRSFSTLVKEKWNSVLST